MRSWRVKIAFGRTLQVRLTDGGALQKRVNGKWQLLRKELIDLGMVTVEDIEATLKGMPGVVKVTRQRG